MRAHVFVLSHTFKHMHTILKSAHLLSLHTHTHTQTQRQLFIQALHLVLAEVNHLRAHLLCVCQPKGTYFQALTNDLSNMFAVAQSKHMRTPRV